MTLEIEWSLTTSYQSIAWFLYFHWLFAWLVFRWMDCGSIWSSFAFVYRHFCCIFIWRIVCACSESDRLDFFPSCAGFCNFVCCEFVCHGFIWVRSQSLPGICIFPSQLASGSDGRIRMIWRQNDKKKRADGDMEEVAEAQELSLFFFLSPLSFSFSKLSISPPSSVSCFAFSCSCFSQSLGEIYVASLALALCVPASFSLSSPRWRYLLALTPSPFSCYWIHLSGVVCDDEGQEKKEERARERGDRERGQAEGLNQSLALLLALLSLPRESWLVLQSKVNEWSEERAGRRHGSNPFCDQSIMFSSCCPPLLSFSHVSLFVLHRRMKAA